ncbi:MAG TPA: CehA/McbA family metallohydrolase [Lacunisphaera sp.]|nr:CehA/McbA family metallohydrolase [Lacunisphaera sp.]
MKRIPITLLMAAALTALDLQANWYKGNTHTHTINSDGNATPDFVARWYREHGYNFVVITDHEYLTDVAPLNAVYAREGQFLVIPGQEVTQHLGKSRDPRHPDVRPGGHLNGLNLKRPVVPLGGTYGKTKGFAPPEMTMAETYDRNIKEILAAGGVAQINHPNWHWYVRLDDLWGLPDHTLFEVWNGQLTINNLGGTDDDGNSSPSTEAMWDALLSKGKKIWAVADDDSHNYFHLDEERRVIPGQAWVVVRAAKLTADDLMTALHNGDFYASTGIVLDDIVASPKDYAIAIKGSSGDARFLTRFIGREGRVLAEVPGTKPHYVMKGDEGYVRASIIDSNGVRAWTQPVFLDGDKVTAK